MHTRSPLPLLGQARAVARSGDSERAAQLYRELLAREPDSVEALNFTAVHAFAHGRAREARALLGRALGLAFDDIPTRKNLAMVLLHDGAAAEALPLLQKLVEDAPDYEVGHLYLGAAHDRLGQEREAIAGYFRAVSAARAQGLWGSPGDVPAALRPMVTRAADRIRDSFPRLLHATLAPLRQRYGRDALVRVEACMGAYLGQVTAVPPDPLQRPTFLYFPGLPAPRYLPRELVPWHAALEARTAVIREELLAVLAADAPLEPFLGTPPPGQKPQHLDGTGDVKPRWDGLFFHRHGERNEENCARCPATAAALDETPIVRIPGHAPEALYSVLGPGSHILPHYGVTNTRVVTHLPLIVPEGCALSVAGDEHHWREGRCMTFDDTYRHEAWNRSDRTRVVLLFDVWNPHLTEVEREAVTDLVVAIAELKGEEL